MRPIFVSFYKSTLYIYIYIKVRQHTALMLCDSRRNKTNHVSSVKASEEEIQLSLKALNVYKPSEIQTFRNTNLQKMLCHLRDLKQSRVMQS